MSRSVKVSLVIGFTEKEERVVMVVGSGVGGCWQEERMHCGK